ncbi:hypothetical protein [Weissella cibaria]|nr:hypothetical protein [Weissella cibaria]MBU7543898.1 hypothetical protein [Weissella cibaria]MCV3317235.1 hypothetical protein [Weissella cibaria]NKN29906.1 hypothetical protein [Weissella cibaria]NKN99081.1 hypothetical protein [Weissella cibaria]UOX37000.1 hypothetical protein IDM39_01375 [Weissella cibaria]
MDERKLLVRFGTVIATKIRTRIWEMEQAENLYQLSQYPPAGLHELKGKYAGLFAVNLTGNSSTQLDAVRSVAVIEVIDYH